MTEQKSGTRHSVGLIDIAKQVPGLLKDTPTMVRGVVTGFGARPSAKTSIGKVFQERAAQHAGNVFLKFEDTEITYGEANEMVNRYAAVLAAKGVGHGDVVGIMMRNSPEPILLMLAAVKCGAISGMLNFHQRDEVLKHSLGLLDAAVVVAETEFVEHITDSGADTDGLMTLDDLTSEGPPFPGNEVDVRDALGASLPVGERGDEWGEHTWFDAPAGRSAPPSTLGPCPNPVRTSRCAAAGAHGSIRIEAGDISLRPHAPRRGSG